MHHNQPARHIVAPKRLFLRGRNTLQTETAPGKHPSTNVLIKRIFHRHQTIATVNHRAGEQLPSAGCAFGGCPMIGHIRPQSGRCSQGAPPGTALQKYFTLGFTVLHATLASICTLLSRCSSSVAHTAMPDGLTPTNHVTKRPALLQGSSTRICPAPMSPPRPDATALMARPATPTASSVHTFVQGAFLARHFFA